MSAVTFCLTGLRRILSAISVFNLFVASIMLTSCSTPQPQKTYMAPPPIIEKRVVKIVSSPQEVIISVDNIELGTTPITHEFNFSKNSMYIVTGTKKNYLPVEMTVDLKTVDRVEGTINVYLSQHPFWEITTVKYPANEWFQIILTPEVLEQGFWKKLVQIVKKDHYKIDNIYMEAGIVETAFVTENVSVGGKEEYIRSRLKTKFQEKVPEVKMNIYLETEISNDGRVWTKY